MTQYRMEIAEECRRQTALSAEQIAEVVGYQPEEAFLETYRKYSFTFEQQSDPEDPGEPEIPVGPGDPVGPGTENYFDDVPKTHWAADYINRLAERGIVNGVGDRLFRPEGTVERAMFATMLARLGGEDLSSYGKGGVFSDVTAENFYAPYIEWCADRKIVNGYGDGTFGPYDAITREQIVWMLERYAGKEVVRAAQIYDPLPDGSISRPTETATRAELCKMLWKVIDYMEKNGLS